MTESNANGTSAVPSSCPKEVKVFFCCAKDVAGHTGFVGAVESVVRRANILLEKTCGFRLELKHWKKNISLGSGEPRVQDNINRRLVSTCDVFLLVVWTRLGSPPGDDREGTSYSSGTEEEFHLAKRLAKPIWVFFARCPVDPDTPDVDQLAKVREFKRTLRAQQVQYAEFFSTEEFRELFLQNVAEWAKTAYEDVPEDDRPIEKPPPGKQDFRNMNRGFPQ